MLAIYVQAPQTIEKCAIVNVAPNHNEGIWWNKETNKPHTFTYQDFGVGDLVYSTNVPQIVEKLVENKTGKKIRIGCK